MGTPTELSALIAPYRESFLHYAPRCLRIRTKAGQVVPFAPNRAQRHIHDEIETQIKAVGKARCLILKGRQQGVSTYVEGRYYWRSSLANGKRVFILTHQQEATDNLFAMTQRYHEHCPYPFKPNTKNESAKALTFIALDSEFSVATAGSKGAGRSATAQYLHGSEVAFWPNAEEHMAGIGQTVPNEPGTEIILESTANGEGNLFHSMVMDAMRGRGEYRLIFVPWFWQPEYRLLVPQDFILDAEEAECATRWGLDLGQMSWRRSKIIDDFRGDLSLWAQEYPAEPSEAFQRRSTESYIPSALVRRARDTRGQESRGAKIMGVDPAEYGDDDTAIAYRCGRVVEKVETHAKLGTMEVVGRVALAADRWKPDVINVDCTGIGSGVADRLRELGYPVTRVHFGERAVEQELYAIRRDEMWGEMKRWLEDDPAQLPDDDALQSDLSAPGYSYDSSRRLKLERKEDMKKRGLTSPDRGDALALTFATPNQMAAGSRQTLRNRPAPHWRT